MPATLEHTNFTVTDPEATAAWMCDLFGWRIRWQGEAIAGGYTVHVGTQDQYLALYAPAKPTKSKDSSYDIVGGLNHLGLVVDDLDDIETRLRAAGFTPYNHGDYEPGKRFYFNDSNGIEFEIVQYD